MFCIAAGQPVLHVSLTSEKTGEGTDRQSSEYIVVCFGNNDKMFCPPHLFISFLGLSARILEQSMGARNRVGIGLSYRPARLHRL